MKKLFIDRGKDKFRTAVTEDGKLVELYIDSASDGSRVGHIILGRLQTILPGQFAFVDIGAKKNAFVNLRDGHGLKAGQPVLVQVKKDAVTSKGVYVDTEINLKGRLVILYESSRGEAGVSRKITDPKESRRLKKLVRKHLPPGYGAILRTNAAGADADAISAEIKALSDRHRIISEKAKYAKPPVLLYPEKEESSLLTDLISEDIAEIRISGDDDFFVSVKRNICNILPILEPRIVRHTEENMFSHYGLNRQTAAALNKITNLPCGGFITIEETEACVVIDVNTGSNVGKTSYRQVISETNLQAAAAIASQIRLRNLSGIILVDFIDMWEPEDNAALLDAFSTEIKKDRIPAEIIGMIGLGMVQLTRRKTRPPLSRLLEGTCPECGGKGRVRLPSDF